MRVPWDRVAPLVLDADVTIERSSKPPRVEGRVLRVDADSIELRTQMGSQSITAAEITRIRVHRRTRAPAFILLGAAGGAAIGALFAHPPPSLFKDLGVYQRNADGSSTRLDTSPHPNYGLAAAVGAAIGGVSLWLASRGRGRGGFSIEIDRERGTPEPAKEFPDSGKLP